MWEELVRFHALLSFLTHSQLAFPFVCNLSQLFAAIGELFEEPQVVGVEVSIRSKEDGLAVWTKTNQKRLRFSTLYSSFFAPK